jgi:2-hydroxy-3-oxopropionate reductase
MTIGFIGLGVMGRPMVRNLLANGFDVAVHNRSRPPVDELTQEGASDGGSPAEMGGDCDVIITMLPNELAVQEVTLGKEGVFEHAHPELVFVDMSTISPAVARDFAERAAESGIQALDAPVSGGEVGAIEGSLAIMVGGEEDAFAKALPIFQAMGKTVVHVGASGAGQTVKAANQLLVAGIIELVSEALVLLEASGVDPEPAVRLMAAGLAGNRVMERYAPRMLAREFQPGARVELHHKDLGIVMDLSRESSVSLPVTALVSQLMSALRATGRGPLDHSALFLLIQELSGRSAQDELNSRRAIRDSITTQPGPRTS